VTAFFDADELRLEMDPNNPANALPDIDHDPHPPNYIRFLFLPMDCRNRANAVTLLTAEQWQTLGVLQVANAMRG